VFSALTITIPPLVPKSTVIIVEPCPLVTVAPDGTAQLYDVAPDTALIEYTSPAAFSQGELLPVIVPGIGGIETKLIFNS
jgi:hypothetical protein